MVDQIKQLTLEEVLHSTTTTEYWEEFLLNVNDNKKRKNALKMLGKLDSCKDFERISEEWLCNVLSTHDYTLLKTISSLLELCNITRELLQRNIKPLFSYLDGLLTILLDEEQSRLMFNDFVTFNNVSTLCVKVLLQIIQYLCQSFLHQLSSSSSDGDYKELMRKFLLVFTSKSFSKDCCLLGGTALALLYNQWPYDEHLADHIEEQINILFGIGCQANLKEQTNLIPLQLPSHISSPYSHLAFAIGLLNSAPLLLFKQTSMKRYLFHILFDYIIAQCSMATTDAAVKYLSFQALTYCMDFILLTGVDKVSLLLGTQLFVDDTSKYTNQIMQLVYKHVEDLVDGIPGFVKKTFNNLLKIHSSETSGVSQKREFLLTLSEKILEQSWQVKGKWILLSQLLSFVGYEKVFLMKPNLGYEMMQAMNTCGLPSIVNDVYKNILLNIRSRCVSDEDAIKEYLRYCAPIIKQSLCNSKLLIQQNAGLYFIPTTLCMLPQCLSVFEANFEQGEMSLYSYMMILKCARKAGLLNYIQLIEREQHLVLGLQHIEVDIRINTFNILSYNNKTTEMLPVVFQHHIKVFIEDNLNCDSSKFRQQLLSSLKRILINVRDSCVMLHRQLSNKKNQEISEEVQQQLHQLTGFVNDIFGLSIKCLYPSSMFQRKKTGLSILGLLTEVFVYIHDVGMRKKGSPTDSAAKFLKSLQHSHENESLNVSTKDDSTSINIVGYCDFELVSCLEDQHDEIREAALEILLTHQYLSDDSLLIRPQGFDQVQCIAQALMNSAKFYETDSGAVVLQFIASRLLANPHIGSHLYGVKSPVESYLSFFQCLVNQASTSINLARNDFLKAAIERPVFGLLHGISKCLKVLFQTNAKDVICSTGFKLLIEKLVVLLDEICTVMVCLLAGVYKKDNSTRHIYPSSAEIDAAIDKTLEQCASYGILSHTISHLHCRELLISFCWLNLKSISILIVELGSLCSLHKELLSFDTFKLICNFYESSLIKCRHKGVIEASYTSLTCFAKKVSYVPLYWNYLSEWCSRMIHTVTDLQQNASVTKRSAGIPMLIQSILSAKPCSSSNSLLQHSMLHLLAVAETPLPQVLDMAVDLTHFNVLNILRAIYRDNILSNVVLPYVEEGVIVTIGGFSSSSWSIRSASSLLLGTLLPRMLGQHSSPEESHHSTSVDVFFSWYPKLTTYFIKCLKEQSEHVDTFNTILPHIIPVLTFLSKLSSTSTTESKRLSMTFIPLLESMLGTSVYVVRDLVASSMTAFITTDKVESYVAQLLCKETSFNKTHSLLLILKKLLVRSDGSNIQRGLYELLECKEWYSRVDMISKSVFLDILTLSYKHRHESLQHCLLASFTILMDPPPVAIGQSMFERALVKLLVLLMKEGEGDEYIEIITENLHVSDFHIEFFDQCHNVDFNECNGLKIFKLAMKCIEHCGSNINLVASVLKYIITQPLTDELYVERLFVLQHSYVYLVPSTLPYLSKVLSSSLHSSHLDDLTSSIEAYSRHQVEDHRLAAAQSIGYLLKPLLNKYTAESNDIKDAQKMFPYVKRLLRSVVKLMQDEDLSVRTTATKSLYFICNKTTSCMSPQTNIVLRDFIAYITALFSGCSLYTIWLHELLCTKLRVNMTAPPNGELLLFEQDSNNVYAEEMQLIETISHMLDDLYSCKATIDSRGDIIKDYENLCDIYMKEFQGKSAKNIYELCGHRQEYLRMYKMLTCFKLIKVLNRCVQHSYVQFTLQLKQKYRLPRGITTMIDELLKDI